MSNSTKTNIATLVSPASKPGGDFFNVKSLFEGRNLVIATKHHKESVIAPLFVNAFDANPLVPENFDTDQFGTFSGEVERTASAYETVRMKIKKALELTGETLAIASEGSFGPHPQIGLIPAGEEIVMLIDTVNGIEISASKISTSTNYARQQCALWDEVRKFAIDASFPSHGLILKNDEKLVKGTTSWAELEQAYHQLKKEFSALSVETDMRAMYNPTRMKSIKKATELLIEKINSACPACGFPGFSVVDSVAGLPCNGCGRPSKFSLKHIYQCQHCHNRKEKLFPEGPASDPMYCDYCNP
ncbi:MAG: DUF6671 family protein [Bacteroidota bacterium]|jgi:hypothetical protein|nr:hypothetical protein [Cytophagales bacterium]MCE2957816.1 hypothetical protein [Flammeovirgaceae bacterium]MCZ8071181.1 hypothetical protein [Cytophagales bacterium]